MTYDPLLFWYIYPVISKPFFFYLFGAMVLVWCTKKGISGIGAQSDRLSEMYPTVGVLTAW